MKSSSECFWVPHCPWPFATPLARAVSEKDSGAVDLIFRGSAHFPVLVLSMLGRWHHGNEVCSRKEVSVIPASSIELKTSDSEWDV